MIQTILPIGKNNFRRSTILFLIGPVVMICFFTAGTPVMAQMDQGAVVGTVLDQTGAAVSGAQITLTNTGTGLELHTVTDKSGTYVFSPVKIGSYSVSANSPGFETVTRENLVLQVQQRLDASFRMVPGRVSESITVTTAPPLLQTDDGSTGTTFESKTIESTPLSQLNYVFLAQMAPGITGSVGTGARGQLTGDFVANGQRVEQTNYILDGVDNNVAIQDFVNGSSSVVNPPPYALSEFKVQTTASSAEFGHSAGSVVNATIRSGTNDIHGTLWEYFRNDKLNTATWNSLTKPELHQNLYGATLGAPILHNKVFFFGYGEDNRTIAGNTVTQSVPTPLMRTGDFSELLNPALTSSGIATKLYRPGSAGTVPLTCNGSANMICPASIDPVAQRILSLYPLPNANGGKLYNNNVVNLTQSYLLWQWGTRFDWNISSKDQAFARLAYVNQPASFPSPLGALDGGAYTTDGTNHSLGENLVGSETHIFNEHLANEARFSYNYGNYLFVQPHFSDLNYAASLGLGGIPVNPVTGGGLPGLGITGIASAGTPGYYVQHKAANTYQILDNITKQLGNHSIRAGFSFQSIRQHVLSPVQPLGSYSFSGYFTGNPNVANTGYGAADFLLDQMAGASLSNYQALHDVRWYRSAYLQDDWKANQRLTLNLGLRYDYFQPYKELNGVEGNFVPGGSVTPGGGTGTLFLTNAARSATITPAFMSLLASQNVTIAYSGNPRLVNSQKLNFGPRIGFAFRADQRSVLRGGFGIFFGGLENLGGNYSPPDNYPFQYSVSIPRPTTPCTPGNCGTNGMTLENGFNNVIAAGIANFASQPTLFGTQPNIQVPYTASYNLVGEHALTSSVTATLGYVGSRDLHQLTVINPNAPAAVVASNASSLNTEPFPKLGGVNYVRDIGIGNYNSLQATLNKRFSAGLQFQTSYTWAKSLGDSWSPLESGSGYRAINMIGARNDYTVAASDVRHRLVFNALYQLPFGNGKAYLNKRGILDAIAGGWAADIQYVAQSGLPFTVATGGGFVGPNGATAYAIQVRDPYSPGGAPPAGNTGTTCAAHTRTVQHWFNPCAFTNPTPLSTVVTGTTTLGGLAVLPYLGDRAYQLHGPGWNTVNLSLFKSFQTFREQVFTFRADIFNVPNIPVYSNPSGTDGPTGGQITTVRAFQQFTPTNRFIQFSGVYRF